MKLAEHFFRKYRFLVSRPSNNRSSRHLHPKAWGIALAYGVFATLWIYFSDQTLGLLVDSPEAVLRWSAYKGQGFVLVTSILLLLLMLRAFAATEDGFHFLQAHEKEIEKLQRLYSALSQINQAIVWTRDRHELLQKICRILGEHGKFRLVWVGWHQAEAQALDPIAFWGDETASLRQIKIRTDDKPELGSPSATAFREGRSCICNDISRVKPALPWGEELQRMGVKAFAVFPIRFRGQVAGTLGVYADERDFFQEREINLLGEAATDISFALDNIAGEEERCQAEQKARSEKIFSDTMIESMPGILYLYDEEGRFLRWNRSFETVSGYSGEEIAQMHPRQFFLASEEGLLAEKIGEVFDKGESSVDLLFLCKDRTTVPYFFTGRKVLFENRRCLVGVGIDVSGQKQAEKARLDSEARYRALFEYAPDGIVVADAQSNYLDANPSICRMLQYSHGEMIRLGAAEIVVGEEVDQIQPALERIKATANYQREWMFRRKNGTCFPAEVIATTMPDGNLLGLIRDITQRKETERKMRELNENLEHLVEQRTGELKAALVRAEASDRLKSAFLATMSHELRTPLNSIIGFTGIILQGLAGPLNPEQGKQLGMVRGSARHLLELINDVLDISKIEADQLEIRSESFDFKKSVEHVVALVRPLAEKKELTLTVDYPADLGALVSDRRRVEQILLNLLNNAIKFTVKGGIFLEIEWSIPYSFPAAAEPVSAVRVRVRDTGIGIRAEDMEHLFQPFRQIDSGLTRQHEGTGLGLAICRRLAGLLGGEISAESNHLEGSEFVVTLPIARPTPS